MGAEQSNNAVSDLTDWQGASPTASPALKQQQYPQYLLPQHHQHPTSARIHPAIVASHATSTPAISLNTTSTVSLIHPAREPLPAVIIASRGTIAPLQQQSSPLPASQPYLPHAQATLTYLDSLLSKAEATRDLHRANVALVADKLKTIQELTMGRMDQEAKQREEQRAEQTEMTIAEHEKEEDYGEPFAKRVRRQLIDETQSLYMDSLEQQQQHDASFSPIADDLPPPSSLPQLFSTSDSSTAQRQQMSSGMMSTEDLLALINPMEIYAPEAPNFDNDTGLIGGVATGTTQGESELFVNKVMAELEETRTPSPDRASSVVAASSSSSFSVSLNNSTATSVIDDETSAWSQSSRSWTKISKKFLANFQKINALAVLERAHQNGLISLDVLTQYLGFIKMLLEQEDHDSLMQQFNAMHVKGKGPSSIALASSQVPQWVDDLIPEESAPDDPDGVPRMRILLRYSTSADETYQQIQEEKKRRAATGGRGGGGGRKQKRKQSERDDIDDSADSDHMTVLIKRNESSEIIPEIGSSSSSSSSVVSSSSTATTPISPAPTQVAYRIAWFNSAFERTFGYTQLQMRHEFSLIGQRIIYLFVRSDHVAAFHLILMKMKFEGKTELHMYQVRMTRDGREIYCLLHVRVNSIKGKMMDGCMSIIPLPDEAQKDMPPFQEGVDLHEDVLLYGYKKPSC